MIASLNTPRLTLRRFRPTDADDLYAYLADAQTYRFEPGEPLDRAQAAQRAAELATSPDFWAVELNATGKVIGQIYLKQIEPPEHLTCELGYILSPAYQRRGYGAEAAAALVRQALTAGGMHRVVAHCNPDNVASWRLLERIGFRREARHRQDIFFRRDAAGAPLWTDTYVYARLAAEVARRPADGAVRPWITGYRILLIGLCSYAILAYSGALRGRFNGEVFSFFTILSVLLALLYFSVRVILSLARRTAAKDGGPGPAPALAHFKGGVTLAVTITMIVYHFFLARVIFEMVGYQPFSPNDLIVHYAIPLMVILDWLLFDPKPTYGPADPLKWLGIPLAYFIFALLRAPLGGELRGVNSRYPYFFLDIDALGLGPVLLNVLLLAVGFLCIGYVLFGVDRLLGRKKNALGRNSLFLTLT